MTQITSFHQLQELTVGSTVIQRELETPIRFSILSCTPIGWEDIEFELLPVGETSGRVIRNTTSAPMYKLGSEFLSEPVWWVPLY